ncbi:MAG: helix-turn-helix domain-containing protein [Solirubrobacterales bacterium]
MAKKPEATIPRFALTPTEAAASIGCGEDFFTAYVRPDLKIVRKGRKVLVPCAELERWLRENAEPAGQVGR